MPADFAFAHFELPYLIALVHPDTLASHRVAEKCGFAAQDTLALWGDDPAAPPAGAAGQYLESAFINLRTNFQPRLRQEFRIMPRRKGPD